MPRKVTILENHWVTLANEDEVTVGQRENLQRAVADSIVATYTMTSLARKKSTELENALTDTERAEELTLTEDEQKSVAQFRANTAEILALRDMPEDDQRKIGEHQRARILCYLVGWDRNDQIPTESDHFNDLQGSWFDAIFDACNEGIPEAPDFSLEAVKDPKVRTGSSVRSGSSAKAKS